MKTIATLACTFVGIFLKFAPRVSTDVDGVHGTAGEFRVVRADGEFFKGVFAIVHNFVLARVLLPNLIFATT